MTIFLPETPPSYSKQGNIAAARRVASGPCYVTVHRKRLLLRKEIAMYGKDRIYKKVEIIGVSGKGIEAAIEAALVKARNSLDQLSWFEVQDIRGHVGEDGKVTEYQVVLKVAFQLKD
jgi:dodecin